MRCCHAEAVLQVAFKHEGSCYPGVASPNNFGGAGGADVVAAAALLLTPLVRSRSLRFVALDKNPLGTLLYS